MYSTVSVASRISSIFSGGIRNGVVDKRNYCDVRTPLERLLVQSGGLRPDIYLGVEMVSGGNS